MKQYLSFLLIAVFLLMSLFTGCACKESHGDAATTKKTAKEETADTLTPVTLHEVAHSIFYAPMYVAIQAGYFQEEGIALTLVNGNGADNVMTALISDSADIGFMGSEASVYVYTEGMKDYVVNFAQLTQRAGNFLVAKQEAPDFQWTDLKGKKVLGGRAGGMPQMVFEYILKKNGIDPVKDLTIDQSVSFGNTAAAFMGSDSFDYTVEFEPFATTLETEKAGSIVASLGVDSGYVPYTAYCAKKSFLSDHPELIQAFTNALQKGMDYVQTHSPEEIATIISPQFKETSMDSLTTILTRYYEQDTWKDNLIFEEDSFTLLLDILKEADQLNQSVPYKDLVDTSFAQKAASH